MADLPIRFPAIGLGPDVGANAVAGTELVWGYSQSDHLTMVGPTALRDGYLIGMVLFDSADRAWTIRGVTPGKPAGSFLIRLIDLLFRGGLSRHCELDLAAAPPMSLDDLKARIRRSIEAHPDDWIDEELTADESGKPVSENRQLERVRKRVQSCRTVKEIIRKFELDWTAW